MLCGAWTDCGFEETFGESRKLGLSSVIPPSLPQQRGILFPRHSDQRWNAKNVHKNTARGDCRGSSFWAGSSRRTRGLKSVQPSLFLSAVCGVNKKRPLSAITESGKSASRSRWDDGPCSQHSDFFTGRGGISDSGISYPCQRSLRALAADDFNGVQGQDLPTRPPFPLPHSQLRVVSPAHSSHDCGEGVLTP